MAHLPYIRMKANDCPGVACIIFEYGISFISESFARKANLLDKIDRSDCQTISVSAYGGGKLLGWVNDAQIRIDELNQYFVYRLGVMPDKHLPMYCQEKFDMLLGYDLLYALRGITRRGKIAKFLTEEEIRRERSHRGRVARAICAMMGILLLFSLSLVVIINQR